jgi:hypothetical protein
MPGQPGLSTHWDNYIFDRIVDSEFGEVFLVIPHCLDWSHLDCRRHLHVCPSRIFIEFQIEKYNENKHAYTWCTGSWQIGRMFPPHMLCRTAAACRTWSQTRPRRLSDICSAHMLESSLIISCTRRLNECELISGDMLTKEPTLSMRNCSKVTIAATVAVGSCCKLC